MDHDTYMTPTHPRRNYHQVLPLLPLLHSRRLFSSILVICILALCHIFLVSYILDVPKPIYHCPLVVDQDHASSSSIAWFDENCYWSTSYVEAREKFVALGNRLKSQTILLKNARHDGNGGIPTTIIDVRSISYKIIDPPLVTSNKITDDITKAATQFDLFTPQTITPGTNTVDAILITLKISSNNHDDGSGVSQTDDENTMSRENLSIIHSSGVHGVEGYLGSAIQIRFLHELLLQSSSRADIHPVNSDLHSKSSSVSSSTGTTTPISGDKVRKILLIHSVNPYGMRHHRRTNENNVDLNRNVLSESTWKEVRTRHPNKYRYVDMDSILNPFQSYNLEDGEPFSWVDAARKGGHEGDVADLYRHDAQDNTRNSHQCCTSGIMHELPPPKSNMDMLSSSLLDVKHVLRTLKSALIAIFTLGYTDAKRAIVSAQYHKPSGLSYGGGAHNNNNGNAWENSVLAVQHAINEFGGYRFSMSTSVSSSDSSSSSSALDEIDRTLWIDVHTGLGKYGEYSILTRHGMSSVESKEEEEGQSSCSSHNNDSWMTKFTSLLERQQMGYGQSSSSASVSAGYEQTQGFITDSILCPPPYCNGITQEFGTRPSIGVIVALVLENMGYHTAGERGRTPYGHFLTWAFNPQRLSWRRKTLRGGMEMLHTALQF